MDSIPMLTMDSIAPASGAPDAAAMAATSEPGAFNQALAASLTEAEGVAPETMLDDHQLLALLALQTTGEPLPGPNMHTTPLTETAQQVAPSAEPVIVAGMMPSQQHGKGLEALTVFNTSEGDGQALPDQRDSALLDTPEIDLAAPATTLQSMPAGPKQQTEREPVYRAAVMDSLNGDRVQKIEVPLAATAELEAPPPTVEKQAVEAPVDPRFSKLLGQLAEPKQSVKTQTAEQALRQQQIDPDIRAVAEPDTGKVDVELDNSTGKGTDPFFIKTGQPATEPLQPTQAFQLHRDTAPVEQTARMPEMTSIRLTSGQVVDERQIFNQVAGQIRTNVKGDLSQASLKLYPEELGEVRLDLTVENDRLRASIHAQSSQVQDVLERHLPRLRDALEQQGLKIETLQVNLDSQRGESGQFGQQRFAEHAPGHQSHSQSRMERGQPEQESQPAQPVPFRAGQGLSLRV